MAISFIGFFYLETLDYAILSYLAPLNSQPPEAREVT